MAQIWHLWQELLRSTSESWKPEGINYTVIEDFNVWQILTESVPWADNLKLLKSFVVIVNKLCTVSLT